jgi:hypothetical protein
MLVGFVTVTAAVIQIHLRRRDSGQPTGCGVVNSTTRKPNGASVTITGSDDDRAPVGAEAVSTIDRRSSRTCQATDFLRDLAASGAGVYWYDDFSWEELCLTAPAAMADLFRQTRVLINHEINILPGLLTKARVDLFFPEWPVIAHRVADDLLAQRLPTLEAPVTFEARYFCQAPAADYARQYRLG